MSLQHNLVMFHHSVTVLVLFIFVIVEVLQLDIVVFGGEFRANCAIIIYFSETNVLL